MRIKSLTSALIAGSMIAAAPTAAIAQTAASASKLSVVQARAGTPAGDSQLAGGPGGVIAIALLAGIVAIGVLAVVNSDDGETPASA